jgi:hypothetical protein
MGRWRRSVLSVLGALVLPAAGATAQTSHVAPGSWLHASIEVDSAPQPLYAAVDGSGRYYFEARKGARYAIRVANRTGERVGVKLAVDGLNVISGELDRRGPGRMYVLGPWEDTLIQGWRTSLDSVQQFTFVEEGASYAVRSGKPTGKLGWVEIEVYRERRPLVVRNEGRVTSPAPATSSPEQAAGAGAPAPAGRPSETEQRKGRDAAAPAANASEAQADARSAEGAARSYPGTGWGPRADDRAVLVDFTPEPRPAERLTLRYEYASGLRALGLLPQPWWGRDRLQERDRGEGFAKPPAW